MSVHMRRLIYGFKKLRKHYKQTKGPSKKPKTPLDLSPKYLSAILLGLKLLKNNSFVWKTIEKKSHRYISDSKAVFGFLIGPLVFYNALQMSEIHRRKGANVYD